MTTATIIWTISTVLLLSHITFGGLFILVKSRKIDAFTIAAVSVITPLLINMLLSIGTINWYWSLIAAFLGAIIFHLHIRRRLDRICLQEYINYKIFIEAYGIILCFVGIAASLLLPQLDLIYGILSLLYFLRLSWLVIFKKKAYGIDYPNHNPLNDPKISIVIIAFNEEKYIGHLLESIKKQTYKNFEVILVDDHSEDDTVKIAKTHTHDFPLQIVQKPVRGCSRSRNFGAENSTGELILFLDADAILPPDFLKKGLAEFNAKHLSLAFFDFTPITDKKIDHTFTAIYRFWLKAVQYHNPRAIGSCIMIRRDLHKKILFDETVVMAEDFDYVLRASQHGKFRMLNEPRYQISWRRFDVENRLKLVIKYLLFEIHRQLIGEIRKPIMKYNFGHFGKKK